MSYLSGDVEFVSFDELIRLLERVFLRHGAAESVARILASNCASCERDGGLSHGIFRVPGYVKTLASGWVDGHAVSNADKVGPSYLRIDAANGYAQSALEQNRGQILDMLRGTGVAIVAIRDSHHFSALWPDLEPFAELGYVGITVVTGGTVVVPPGGTKRVLGTNPMAFCTPVAGGSPMIFDFATSSMSHGDLRLAVADKRKVPFGTGVDGDGNLTDDPSVIHHEGGILPFGGHKGAALSLMVEILASAFTGGKFASEVDFSSFPGAESPCTGQLLILLDPGRDGNQNFSHRVKDFLDSLKEAGQERLPSAQRYAHRKKALAEGIPISKVKLGELRGFLGD